MHVSNPKLFQLFDLRLSVVFNYEFCSVEYLFLCKMHLYCGMYLTKSLVLDSNAYCKVMNYSSAELESHFMYPVAQN